MTEIQLDPDIQAMLDERGRTMQDFTVEHRPLNLYAIYRSDLDMPPGKMAALMSSFEARTNVGPQRDKSSASFQKKSTPSLTSASLKESPFLNFW